MKFEVHEIPKDEVSLFEEATDILFYSDTHESIQKVYGIFPVNTKPLNDTFSYLENSMYKIESNQLFIPDTHFSSTNDLVIELVNSRFIIGRYGRIADGYCADLERLWECDSDFLNYPFYKRAMQHINEHSFE